MLCNTGLYMHQFWLAIFPNSGSAMSEGLSPPHHPCLLGSPVPKGPPSLPHDHLHSPPSLVVAQHTLPRPLHHRGTFSLHPNTQLTTLHWPLAHMTGAVSCIMVSFVPSSPPSLPPSNQASFVRTLLVGIPLHRVWHLSERARVQATERDHQPPGPTALGTAVDHWLSVNHRR